MEYRGHLRRKGRGIIFTRLVNRMILAGLYGLAGTLLSIRLTIAEKRRTRVRWDGEHWEFTWSGGCIYWDSIRMRPKAVTEINIDFFCSSYQPKTGDTILDVGAGVGTEIPAFSEMVGASGRVIAIEADPAAVRRLEKQAASLKSKNVTVLGVAVGGSDGTARLHVTKPGGVQNSTVAAVADSAIVVPQRALAEILSDYGVEEVAYMKMNIEGAEYDALVGLGQHIGKIKEMCVSCHDFTGNPAQRTYQKVSEYLARQGLQVNANPPNPQKPWEEYYLFASRN